MLQKRSPRLPCPPVTMQTSFTQHLGSPVHLALLWIQNDGHLMLVLYGSFQRLHRRTAILYRKQAHLERLLMI